MCAVDLVIYYHATRVHSNQTFCDVIFARRIHYDEAINK